MITKEELKDRIVSLIEASQGCKAMELIPKFDRDILVTLEVVELHTALAELLHERRIVEIEYTVPNIPGRAKSFLLPKGSEVMVHRGD